MPSRFFQPHNGERIDAVRDAIDTDYRGSALEPVLLTSLLEAADRVDSTTGVQMAYVKQWAPRSFRPLELRVPELLAGPGPRRPGRRLRRGGRTGGVRPRLSRPALQPAPLRGQLPHLGNAGGLGRPGPLRGGLQADGDPRRSPQRLQLAPDDGRRPGPGGPRRPGRRGRPLLQRRVLDRPRRPHRDVPGPRPRGGPRLPLQPLRRAPASGSTTRPGSGWGRWAGSATSSTSWWPGPGPRSAAWWPPGGAQTVAGLAAS